MKTFKLNFTTAGQMSHSIRMTDDRFSAQDVIDGLESGDFHVTFGQSAGVFITESGARIADITNTEAEGAQFFCYELADQQATPTAAYDSNGGATASPVSERPFMSPSDYTVHQSDDEQLKAFGSIASYNKDWPHHIEHNGKRYKFQEHLVMPRYASGHYHGHVRYVRDTSEG
jgi:hypothetical protein